MGLLMCKQTTGDFKLNMLINNMADEDLMDDQLFMKVVLYIYGTNAFVLFYQCIKYFYTYITSEN